MEGAEKSSNMPKIWQNMKKSSVQLALNPFLHGTSKTPKFDFGYIRDQSLILIASSRRNSPFAKKLWKTRGFCYIDFLMIWSRSAIRGSIYRSQKPKQKLREKLSKRGDFFRLAFRGAIHSTQNKVVKSAQIFSDWSFAAQFTGCKKQAKCLHFFPNSMEN